MHSNNLHFLRFVLACLVILGHAYALTDPQGLMSYSGHFFFSSLTALSVNAFFTISGFLIYQSIERASSWSDYLRKRALRILPLFFLVILLSVPFAGLFFKGSFKDFWHQADTWTYLLRNLSIFKLQHTIAGVFSHNPKPYINGSLWSIPYEIICYILFSVIFLLKKTSNHKWLPSWLVLGYIATQLIYFSIHIWKILPASDYVGTLARCVLLFYNGVMLAKFWHPKKIHWNIAVLCLLLFVGVYYGRNYLPFLELYMLFPVPFSIVIMYVAFLPSRRLASFAAGGDASYGIYLLGFPVQQMWLYHFANWHPVYNALATYAIVIPLAYLSWHYIEQPILRR